jgi:hypothetical protein
VRKRSGEARPVRRWVRAFRRSTGARGRDRPRGDTARAQRIRATF